MRTWPLRRDNEACCRLKLLHASSWQRTKRSPATAVTRSPANHNPATDAARLMDHWPRLYRLVEPAARQPVVYHATAFRTAVHTASSSRHACLPIDASVRGADLPRPCRVAHRTEGRRHGAHLPGAKSSNGQREAPWYVQAGRLPECHPAQTQRGWRATGAEPGHARHAV